MCKCSKGRLSFPVLVQAFLVGTQPLSPSQGMDGGWDSSMAQHGAVLTEKKSAGSPEMLHPACHKGQLLPSHLQKRDPSLSVYRANAVRYPPTHHF